MDTDTLERIIRLREQVFQLQERLMRKDRIIQKLERSKFSVTKVYLNEDIADRSLCIISVDSSPDGLIIRVAK